MKSPDTIRKHLEEKCKRFGVEILYVFGSRARETQNLIDGNAPSGPASSSDVDFGVKMRPTVSLSVREKVRLSTELEDLLSVARIDLCVLQEVDPFVAASIVRGERIFSEDPHQADEYELYVLRKAGDLAHLERERLTLILGETQA